MSLRMEAGFEHLRETMADILTQTVEFPQGVFVTVLKAKITANSANASVVLSVFPSGMQHERAVIDTLEAYRPEIKQELSERLRLRRIPNLHYTFDRTEAEAADIEKILRSFTQSSS